MNDYSIRFTLLDHEMIVIQAEDPVETIYNCYYVPTVFISGSREYKLSRYNPKYIAESLAKTLKKVLDYKTGRSKGERAERIKVWLGESASEDKNLFSTWMYNNQDGDIVLEINEERTEIGKPLLTRIIPDKIAYNWLEQSEDFVRHINENITRMEASTDTRLNQLDIVFSLKNNDSMTLELPDSLFAIICCNRGMVVFRFDDICYQFSISGIEGHMECLSEMLKKASSGDLKLHPSMLAHDIGYLWNEAYRDRPGFVYEGNDGEVQLWVGDKYRIWCSREAGEQCFSAWIYNAEDDSIIIEITPDYPWYNSDAEEYADYIPYEEWIMGYKSAVKRTIPIDVVYQWIEQADYIKRRIEENIECMEQECNAGI